MAEFANPFDLYKSAVEKANAEALQYQAATADAEGQIKAVLETSDDPKLVKYREGVAILTAEIAEREEKLAKGKESVKEYAKTLIPSAVEGYDPEAGKAAYLEARRNVTALYKGLQSFFDEDTLKSQLEAMGIQEVTKLKGSGVKGAATGVKRPRISAATINKSDVAKKDGTVDFTFLAKELKANADDVKAAAFKAAGTDDLNSLGAGHVVSFTYAENAVTVTISDKKPGRPAKAETEDTPTES